MKDWIKEHGAGMGCLLVFLVLVLIIAFAALEAWVVMLLWNNVLCAIFANIPTITFWLAWGLMILCNILFKGFSVSSKKE